MKHTKPTGPTKTKIWTSSFRAAGREPNAVAIARGVPSWFRGRVFDPLRPTRAMLGLCNPAEFDRQYAAMLMQLEPYDVAEQLAGSILLCWEPQRFDRRTGTVLCHRHTVAQFLATDGVPLPEWTERDRMQLTFAL